MTALTRKVELLERWGRDGLPDGVKTVVPSDRAKLRRWVDPSRGLWAWADPMVDAVDGRNAVIMQRFWAAMKAIDVRLKDKGRNYRREAEASKLVIASLEAQNLRLLDEVRRLQLMAGVSVVERR